MVPDSASNANPNTQPARSARRSFDVAFATVDLSALPAAALWRWDLAVRLCLSVAGPLVAVLALPEGVQVVALAAALTAALVSLSSLGPDLSSRPWVLLAAVGVPAAVLLGAVSTRLPAGGTLVVFALFTIHGAMVRTALLAQLAWFPVATAGLLAALLVPDGTALGEVALGAVVGSAWALALMWLVPLLVRAPRLPIPTQALVVDTARLRRMVTRPTWRDWLAPLALGAMSATLLAVTTVLTGGFKPYWAVLAFVSVLAPSAAKTRESAVQTAVASVVGVALAGGVLTLGLAPAATIGLILVMAVGGSLLLLRNGTLSKTLMTPLPVVTAAAALDVDQSLALQLRLAEYVAGAALGAAAVVAADYLGRRLWHERLPDPEGELVG